MTFAAETNAEQLARTGRVINDDVGRDLPRQRTGVITDDPVSTGSDFSLSALVRQWLTKSEALERQGRPAGDVTPMPPTWTPPQEDVRDHAGDPAPVVKHAPSLEPVEHVDPVEPVEQVEPVTPTVEVVEESPAASRPGLPQRRRPPPPLRTRRLAVLIDAESTTAQSADGLFEALADQGTVSVCRAYADWTSPEALSRWSASLHQHGIQPHHHFGRDQRSLVALTIDAVDLARESAVDVVAIVGDLVSLHPLVLRLNASGLKVFAFGTTTTPHDVRALCHEFVDLHSSGPPDSVHDDSVHDDTIPAGRHRA